MRKLTGEHGRLVEILQSASSVSVFNEAVLGAALAQHFLSLLSDLMDPI